MRGLERKQYFNMGVGNVDDFWRSITISKIVSNVNQGLMEFHARLLFEPTLPIQFGDQRFAINQRFA